MFAEALFKKNNSHFKYEMFFFFLFIIIFSPFVADAAQKAAVHTAAPDRTGSNVAIVDVNPVNGPRNKVVDNWPQVGTSFILRSFGNYYYLIGNTQHDNITKFHIDDPETPIWQVSTADPAETDSPAVHDLVFVGSEKAYVLNYKWTRCTIINPVDGSKLEKELDLSAYSDADGTPELDDGVIVGKKLFVLMIRANRDNKSAPEVDSYVAVFDITTDTEIDTAAVTGIPNADGLKGIRIPGRGASCMQYLPENNTIYVAAHGMYPGSGADPDLVYTGGIFSINPDTYEVKKLLDDGPDGEAGDHPYPGSFAAVKMYSPTKSYFIIHGDGTYGLYPWNPTTLEVGSPLAEFDGKSMDIMDNTNPRDENGLIWIGAGKTECEIYVLNPQNDTIDEKINTGLNPKAIAFCPQTVWPGSNIVQAATGSGPIEYSFNKGTKEYFESALDSKYEDPSNPADGADTVFRDGLIEFQVSDLGAAAVTRVTNNGSSLEATIKFPSKRKADDTYYVVDSGGKFVALGSDNIKTEDDYTVVLTLTDGDAYDNDGQANGTVTHVGGYAGEPDSTGSGSGGGGGGGGCFVGAAY